MQIIEWNNGTPLHDALTTLGDGDDGSGITFKLTANFTGTWKCPDFSKLVPEKDIVIDLNGFTVKPSSFIVGVNHSHMFIFDTNYSYRGKLSIIDGVIDARGLTSNNRLFQTAGSCESVNSDDYICKRVKFIMDDNISSSNLFFGWSAGLNFAPCSEFQFLSCVVIGGDGFVNAIVNGWDPRKFVTLVLEDFAYIQRNSTDMLRNNTSGAINWGAAKFKRTYSVNDPVEYTTGLAYSGYTTDMYTADADAPYALSVNRGIEFTEDNFYSVDHTDPLFLVPKTTNIMSDVTKVSQGTHNVLYGNTIGINGIESNGGGRIVGPAGKPNIVDGPTNVVVTRPGKDVVVNWTPNPDQGLGLTSTEIYMDPHEIGEFTNIVATVPFSETTVTIPNATIPTDKVYNINLKHK